MCLVGVTDWQDGVKGELKKTQQQPKQLVLWLDAEVGNDLKGFKIQGYNPPCSGGGWVGGGGGE